MTAGQISRAELLKMVVARFGAGLVGLCVVLFLPAGTLGFWQAWVWLGILGVPLCVLLVYMLRRNPALLERRLCYREREAEQSLIIKLSYIPVLVARIHNEERVPPSQLEGYADYVGTVRYRLIPGVW